MDLSARSSRQMSRQQHLNGEVEKDSKLNFSIQAAFALLSETMVYGFAEF